ncbi:MAG: hypothetical protein FWG30_04395 [Eubacteriaceae bacterium]|nr:hypothetical protein [Eubacteriaceae bacterium]
MKTHRKYALMLAVLLTLTASCSPAASTSTNENKEGEQTAAPTYKDTMLPFEQLIASNRIIILQNAINYSRPGFYDSDTKPQAENIELHGEEIAAYPMGYALAFLHSELTGAVSVFNVNGESVEIGSEDFAGMYAIVEFESSSPPMLYNPETGTSAVDFSYAITSNGEAIYSVASNSIHSASGLISLIGWDTGKTYRYVATDKFYIPVGPEDNEAGEIRGTLSGAINASFPNLAIASGKINDVIYIEEAIE